MPTLSTQHRAAKATAGYATEQRPGRTRPIDRRAIACPDCTAGVGETCVTANGKPGVHRSRIRLTNRLHNERTAGKWDLLVELDKVSFKERRAVVRRSGVTKLALAERFGVNPTTFRDWLINRQPAATDSGFAFAEWMLAEIKQARGGGDDE